MFGYFNSTEFLMHWPCHLPTYLSLL